jgi:hypothetical protein
MIPTDPKGVDFMIFLFMGQTSSSMAGSIHWSNLLAAACLKHDKFTATQISPLLLLLEAFFFPWVSGVAIALPFPISGLIPRGDFYSLYPLGTLVEVAIRDHGTYRGTVLFW